MTPRFPMKSMLTVTLMFMAAAAPANAQMTAPSPVGTKPKTVTTVPIRPALQTPADTANAMAQADRLAIQTDLAWVGKYNGAITGEVSERMVAAIKEFQKDRGGKQTGVLNPQERSALAETARRRQENVGWKIVTDAGPGAAQRGQSDHGKARRAGKEGTRWPQGRLQRGQAGFLRAVGHAGPEEILRARHLQGRRGSHPDRPLRPGHRG